MFSSVVVTHQRCLRLLPIRTSPPRGTFTPILLLRNCCEQGRIYSQRGPVQKKNVGPFNWGGRPYFSWENTGDLFSHHRPWVSCQFASETGDPFLLITLVSIRDRPLFRSGIAHFPHIHFNRINVHGSTLYPSTGVTRKLRHVICCLSISLN